MKKDCWATENELSTVIKQYEAVVKQNRELQQENKKLLDLFNTSYKVDCLFHDVLTKYCNKAKVYEDLQNAIKEVQNV